MATRRKVITTVRDLTNWTHYEYAKVRAELRKVLRQAEMTCPSNSKFLLESNNKIDARIDFYGQYIQLNEQVTLQNQDPVLNEAAARLGVSLRFANRRSINKGYAGRYSSLH
jgi:hypothetical protein